MATLSSRAPNTAAARVGSGGALADALTNFNVGHLANSLVSNTILCGLAQATGFDQYFDPPAGAGMLTSAVYDAAYVSLVNQGGAVLRNQVPMLRLW